MSNNKRKKHSGGNPRNNQGRKKVNQTSPAQQSEGSKETKLHMFRSGDWNDKSRWSPQANRQMWTVGLRHDNYQEEIDAAARKIVVRRLVDDIHLAMFPRTMVGKVKSDPDAMTDMLIEALYLMQQYGRYGVLCGDTIPTAYHKKSVKIVDGLWLVNATVGMPLEQFLYHLIDGCPHQIIEEWSGIPHQLIGTVYRCVISWMRDRVAEEHQLAAQYETDNPSASRRKFSLRGRNVEEIDVSFTF